MMINGPRLNLLGLLQNAPPIVDLFAGKQGYTILLDVLEGDRGK